MFVKIHFILYCGNLSYWNYIWWRQTSLNMMCNIMWELFLLCKSSVPVCCSNHCYCHSEKTCASKDKQLLVSAGFTNKSRLANSYSNYITVGNEHFSPHSTLFCLLTFLKVETKYCHSSRSTRTVQISLWSCPDQYSYFLCFPKAELPTFWMAVAPASMADKIIVLDDDDEEESPQPSCSASKSSSQQRAKYVSPLKAQQPVPTHITQSPFASAKKNAHVLQAENRRLFAEVSLHKRFNLCSNCFVVIIIITLTVHWL